MNAGVLKCSHLCVEWFRLKCVCGSCSVHPRLLLLLLPPHTLSHWRGSAAWSHFPLLSTPCWSLMGTERLPWLHCHWHGCVASSSHDGTLLCPSPRDSREIEGLCVEVKSRWLRETRPKGGGRMWRKLGLNSTGRWIYACTHRHCAKMKAEINPFMQPSNKISLIRRMCFVFYYSISLSTMTVQLFQWVLFQSKYTFYFVLIKSNFFVSCPS